MIHFNSVYFHQSYYSVKQKLSQLLPREKRRESREEVTSSPVDLSIDDTLRNTSPIPDTVQLPSDIEQLSVDSEDRHSGVENRKGPLFIRSNSYTLEKPSVELPMTDDVSFDRL